MGPIGVLGVLGGNGWHASSPPLEKSRPRLAILVITCVPMKRRESVGDEDVVVVYALVEGHVEVCS